LQYLAETIFLYLPDSFTFDPTTISRTGCKIYQFYNYGFDAISPWCLVYISAEKFISIAYHSKRFLFKKKKNQIIFLIILFAFNFVLHINIPFSFDIVTFKNISICDFVDDESQVIVSFMDFVNFVLVPFILMILFSSLLIVSIFKSRRRTNNPLRENKRFNKDVKFAISLLLMNFLFIILNMPFDVVDLFSFFKNNDSHSSLAYFFNLSSAVNFYVVLLTNSLFRKEFFHLFIKKKDQERNFSSRLDHAQSIRISEATF